MIAQTRTKILIGLFVALAVMVQSLIPVGYMPSFKAGEVFEIVICHGADQKTVFVDEHMNPIDSKNHVPADQMEPCVFFGVAIHKSSSPPIVAEYIAQLIYEEFVPTNMAQSYFILNARPYFGQGPPVTLS